MSKNTETNTAAHAQLLRVAEVADRLAVSTRAVWAMIAAGELPAIRFGKRATRIDARDVDRLVEKLRAKAAVALAATRRPPRTMSRSGRRTG